MDAIRPEGEGWGEGGSLTKSVCKFGSNKLDGGKCPAVKSVHVKSEFSKSNVVKSLNMKAACHGKLGKDDDKGLGMKTAYGKLSKDGESVRGLGVKTGSPKATEDGGPKSCWKGSPNMKPNGISAKFTSKNSFVNGDVNINKNNSPKNSPVNINSSPVINKSNFYSNKDNKNIKNVTSSNSKMRHSLGNVPSRSALGKDRTSLGPGSSRLSNTRDKELYTNGNDSSRTPKN